MQTQTQTQTGREVGPHPCFEVHHSRSVTRIHLPVALKCNIRCAYCNPREDCVNESGPGAASTLLSPQEALARVREFAAAGRDLGVVGIAGPGDPLANEGTFETLRLVGEWAAASGSPAALCVSTNGLALASSVARLVELGVTHVTVTVNAVDPVVGHQLVLSVASGSPGLAYTRVFAEGAARRLIEAQLTGIRAAVAAGIAVKVNTVLVPGVNDVHMEEIAATVASLGAVRMNVMPLIPRAALRFVPAPTAEELEEARIRVLRHLPVMRHCGQCRADAAGLIGEAQTPAEDAPQKAQQGSPLEKASPPAGAPAPATVRVAAASSGSGLVDRHFGQVDSFDIWECTAGAADFVERRQVVRYCGGAEECPLEDGSESAVAAVSDCQIVLCTRIGHGPQKILNGQGVVAHEVYGPVRRAVENASAAFSQGAGLTRTAAMRARQARPGSFGKIGRIKADAS